MRVLAIATVVALALSGQVDRRTVRAAGTDCGDPSPLSDFPDPDFPARAAHVGPLWFVGVGEGDVARTPLRLGYPAKVLAAVEQRLAQPVTLRGRRCDDGRPLRFLPHGFPWRSLPVSIHALQTTGDFETRLAPGRPPQIRPLGYPVPMEFTSPGRWAVTVEQAGRLVGTLVVELQPDPYPASATVGDFRLSPATVHLPRRCRAGPVKRRLIRMFRAFDNGRPGEFARGFTRDGSFEPYTVVWRSVDGRAAIAQFARDRHRAHDGWTATGLSGPTGRVGLPAEAIYGLDLQVSSRGAFYADGHSKIVIDCRSGLVRHWVGPALSPPS